MTHKLIDIQGFELLPKAGLHKYDAGYNRCVSEVKSLSVEVNPEEISRVLRIYCQPDWRFKRLLENASQAIASNPKCFKLVKG